MIQHSRVRPLGWVRASSPSKIDLANGAVIEFLVEQFFDGRPVDADDFLPAVDQRVGGEGGHQQCTEHATTQVALTLNRRRHTSRETARSHRFVENRKAASPRLKLPHLTTHKEHTMRNFSGKAPTFVVWVISLVLFVVALLAQFGVVRLGEPIATWSWILGFGLLLIACRVKGL